MGKTCSKVAAIAAGDQPPTGFASLLTCQRWWWSTGKLEGSKLKSTPGSYFLRTNLELEIRFCSPLYMPLLLPFDRFPHSNKWHVAQLKFRSLAVAWVGDHGIGMNPQRGRLLNRTVQPSWIIPQMTHVPWLRVHLVKKKSLFFPHKMWEQNCDIPTFCI